jgi:hypothetical protein
MEKEYDVFISHASEDKEKLARPLAEFLSNFGIKVWYDDFSLSVGDSLSKSIDKGLISSRYGVIILSPVFFQKFWTDYEFRGLISKQIGENKVILPIWHEISREEVKNYSPTLADIYALNTAEQSLDEIGIELIKAIRPDIYENLFRYVTWKRLIASSKTESEYIGDIKPSKIRHEELPTTILVRAKIIWHVIKDLEIMDYDELIQNFKRDLHPQNEIKIWERIVAAYLDIISEKEIGKQTKRDILIELVRLSMMGKEQLGEIIDNGNNEEIYILRKYIDVV